MSPLSWRLAQELQRSTKMRRRWASAQGRVCQKADAKIYFVLVGAVRQEGDRPGCRRRERGQLQRFVMGCPAEQKLAVRTLASVSTFTPWWWWQPYCKVHQRPTAKDEFGNLTQRVGKGGVTEETLAPGDPDAFEIVRERRTVEAYSCGPPWELSRWRR